MSSKVFVGDSREKLVTGLVNKYEDVRKSGRSYWVSLEAPRGWGKTCVGREFYKRLAVRQDMPYWPDEIDKDNIDRNKVDPGGFNRGERSLPSYLWWGISCSAVRNQGSTSRKLSKEVDRLQGHEDFCLRGIRKQEGGRWRNNKILLQSGFRAGVTANWRNRFSLFLIAFVRLIVEYYLVGVVTFFSVVYWSGGGIISYVIVGLGLALCFFVFSWILRKLMKSRKRSLEYGSITSVGFERKAEDAVVKAVDFIRKVNAPSVPLVMFVEDIQDVDEVWWDLLHRLLAESISLLLITTGLHEKINKPDNTRSADKQKTVVGLMERHSNQLCRINHTEPAGEGFPEGAGLMKLDPGARQEILNCFFPRVEKDTERELLIRLENPLVLEMFCTLYKKPENFEKYCNSMGELEIPIDRIKSLPSEIVDWYKELWKDLPKEVQIALAVARVVTPANINAESGHGEDLWNAPVLCKVLEKLSYDSVEIPSDTEMSAALEREPKPVSWVCTIDDYLRAFVEDPQKDIASEDGFPLLKRCLGSLVDDTSDQDMRDQILTQLKNTLLSNTEWNGTSNVARCILALHAEGYIINEAVVAQAEKYNTEDTAVGQAINATLEDLDNNLRELPERIRLYERFQKLNVTRMDPRTIFSVHARGANAYGQSGKFDKSIKVFRKLVEDCRRDYGIKDEDTRYALYCYGTWLEKNDDLVEAKDTFEELYDYYHSELGRRDPKTLAVRGQLASLLVKADRDDEAKVAFKELHDDFHKILSREHRNTLAVRAQLASLLAKGGRLKEAIADFRKLLDDCRDFLDDNSPDTLSVHNQLASLLVKDGRWEEAKVEYYELLSDHERILGKNDSKTHACLGTLTALIVSDRFDIDKVAFDKLCDDYRRILGPYDPSTFEIRGKLATRLFDDGRCAEAIADCRKLVDDAQKHYDRDHLYPVLIQHKLASFLLFGDRLDEAMVEYDELIPAYKRVFGNNRPNTHQVRAERERERTRVLLEQRSWKRP